MSLATLLKIDATRNFLQDGDIYEALLLVAEKHHLASDRVDEFLDLTDAVLDAQISLEEIPALLAEAFGLSTEASRALAVDVVGTRLLPLEHFFAGVPECIVAWGGDVATFGTFRVEKEATTAIALAEHIAERAGVSFSPLLMKRLAFLLEQHVQQQKTEDHLRTFLGRPLTIGGMGLVKEQIDTILKFTHELLAGVRIVEEEELAPKVVQPSIAPQQEEPEPVVQQVVAPVLPTEAPILRGNEQDVPDAQAKKQAEKGKKMESDAIKNAFATAIAHALQKTEALREEVNIPSATFADIVGKMLRGIRDRYQTRNILEREYQVKSGALVTLMEVLIEAEETYRGVSVELLKEKDASISLSEKDATTLEDQEALSADAHNARFGVNDSPPVIPQANVELTVGSIPLAGTPDAQKKVTDVVGGAKLFGPIGQLETMTLADFRRLSSNPEEAVRKMEALLSSLEKIGYEERVRGILAWRKSPLALLSISLITESLNTGVAVAEITARRRSQGQESLGPAEMQALAKWNEKLRF